MIEKLLGRVKGEFEYDDTVGIVLGSLNQMSISGPKTIVVITAEEALIAFGDKRTLLTEFLRQVANHVCRRVYVYNNAPDTPDLMRGWYVYPSTWHVRWVRLKRTIRRFFHPGSGLTETAS